MDSGDFDATSRVIPKSMATTVAIRRVLVVAPKYIAHLSRVCSYVGSVLSSAMAACHMWLRST